jgi:hypothetical protein
VDAEELRDTIAEKTDLTMQQAKEAAAAAVQWIQANLPDDASEQVREFTASASDWAAETLASVGTAAADMMDKATEAAADGADDGGDESSNGDAFAEE